MARLCLLAILCLLADAADESQELLHALSADDACRGAAVEEGKDSTCGLNALQKAMEISATALQQLQAREAKDFGAFDYVIVGAGSAGCPLAAKLAKAGHTVLLLEAGPDDDWKGLDVEDKPVDPLKPSHMASLAYAKGMSDQQLSVETTWPFDQPLTTLEAKAVNMSRSRRAFMTRAMIVGGCSMHNYLMYVRPNKENYDSWGPLWSWERLFPKFKAMEHSLETDVDELYHGKTGDCYVSPPYLYPVDEAWLRAAQKAGFRMNRDINGPTRVGMGTWPTSTVNGTRWSSGKAFLTPAVRALPNFKLVTEAHATQVLFEGKRAVGMKFQFNGSEWTAKAKREVILSAGAFRTPQLLMLSGVGPKDVLEDFDIKAVVINRGVGRNLQDHLMAGNPFLVKQKEALFDYKPVDGYGFTPVGGFFYSSWCKERECTSPDMQLICGQGDLFSAPGTHFCEVGLVGHIQASPGYVTLKSKDPLEHPRVEPHYLSASVDIQRMAEGLKVASEIYKQDPDMFGLDYISTSLGWEEAAVKEFVLQVTHTIWHPVGTCKMGPRSDPLAVVDERLKVYGTQGLRVADASIMPVIPSTNTDQPSRMIGYHLADLILEESRDAL